MTPPEHQSAGAPESDTDSRDAMRRALERQLESSQPQHAPPSISDHVLLHHIGSGAYGDVWLARSTLGTLRAVKIVYRARFDDEHPYEREFNGILKYEPISRTHEGLVQVLHVGRNNEAGCFYYVMELADAASGSAAAAQLETRNPKPETYSPRTLRSELKHFQRLVPLEAAQLTLRLAGALAHLHSHGLVHRDVKPSNVIFVGGQPKLADIGLVTALDSSRSFVGTEGFVPPEGPGSARADIYSLGKLLYEATTGCDRMDFPRLPPLAAEGPLGAVAPGATAISDEDALLELNEVMTRACAPEPARRYANATELAAELNLFLAGRSLRRARNIEQRLGQLKKLAATAFAFLIVTAVALWFSRREEHHTRERAEAASAQVRLEAEGRAKETVLRQRAEAAERESQSQLYTALLEQARATVRSGDVGQRIHALAAIHDAAAISNSVELRGAALAALALPDLRFEREIVGDISANLDPRFERVVICHDTNAVEIRAADDQRLLASLPASTRASAHASWWSADGKFLAVKRDRDSDGYRANLEVWAVAEAKRVLLLNDMRWDAVSFHPSLPRIAGGRQGGAIVVIDLNEARELVRFQPPAVALRLCFAPEGKRIAISTASSNGWMISIHAATDGSLLASSRWADQPTEFSWSPAGDVLAVGDWSGEVRLMNPRTGETHLLGRHKAQAATVTFSPDGRYLFTGGWERELICWDVRGMRRALDISLDSFRLQMHPDGRHCAVRTSSGSLKFYSFEQPTHREIVEEIGARVRHATFSTDGRWLAASGDRYIGVWDLAADAPGALIEIGNEARIYFTPDGKELFASYGNECARWKIREATNAISAPELISVPLRRSKALTSICVASNFLVVTATNGSRIVALDRVDDEDTKWINTSAGINGVSPDGRWLGVRRSLSKSLYVYSFPGLSPVAKLSNENSIAQFHFSPAGEEVALVAKSGLTFWSTANWQHTRTVTNAVAFLYSPGGHTCWVAEDYRSAALRDTRTLETLLPLPIGTHPLAISADGRRLAVSVDLRHLQVWDLAEARVQLRELGLDWPDR